MNSDGSAKEKLKPSRGGYYLLFIIFGFLATKYAINQLPSFNNHDKSNYLPNNKILPSVSENNQNDEACSSPSAPSSEDVSSRSSSKGICDSVSVETSKNKIEIKGGNIDLPSPVPIQDSEFKVEDNCFCGLTGAINEDCPCQIDTVDNFNNYKIYPRLQSLLVNNYFRYIQVNLNKECPFWFDDSTCSFEFCHVNTCSENEVPDAIRDASKIKSDCQQEQELGSVNTSLSLESKREIELWKKHDSHRDFCTIRDEENDADLQFVDLLLNPERFTGYAGPSAHRVWRSIYDENCFRGLSNLLTSFGQSKTDDCIEKRTFYRLISGLHSSINIHLSAKYLLSQSDLASVFKPKETRLVWGPNLTEFRQHFELEKNENSEWLKNLYVIYLVELKAIHKISGLLHQHEFFTGDKAESEDLKSAIRDFLRAVDSFPFHFEETALFAGNNGAQLKADFHHKFTNITRIMDCVGCQKCKLWGKTQVKGLGTALKIVFAKSFNEYEGKEFLSRTEIVALFNAFGRLSESIYELGNFRRLMDSNSKSKTTHSYNDRNNKENSYIPKSSPFGFKKS